MIQLLLATLLLAPAPHALDDDERKPPSPELVKAAVAELQQAFEKGEPAARATLIRKHAEVVDAKVIQWVAKGLRDKDTLVVDASIETLRWMDHPNALSSLEKELKKNKKLRADATHHVAMLKAIGQHGTVSSIPIFTETSTTDSTDKVIQARILALGNVRHVKSIDALMDLINRFGSGRRGRGQAHMADFTLALTVLTGHDAGRSGLDWQKWWRDNKKGFKVSPEPSAALPKQVLNRWNRYWGTTKKKKEGEEGDEGERRRRRKDGGGDGEGGGDGGN